MNKYSRADLSDHALMQGLAAHVAGECTSTAELLADLAEVDARQLYLPAGYPSLYLYCVQELHMAEGAAFKRIRAARTARDFPTIFEAVAKGRLHMSAVVLLTPDLTRDNADDLLAAAAHKSKAEIEHLLAQRFPRPDVPTPIEALAAAAPAVSGNQLSPGTVGCHNSSAAVALPLAQVACGHSPALVPIVPEAPRPRLEPLAPGRFKFQCTLDQSTHDLLCQAQALLGHRVATGDVAQVLHRALALLVHQLERQKFAATDTPRPGHRRANPEARKIPAEVRRAVWEHDGGQCTFTSKTGHRCRERRDVEFDHIDPYARGGEATVSGIRLLCRAHNQLEAERTYGPEFMRHKRIAAAEARAVSKARAPAGTVVT